MESLEIEKNIHRKPYGNYWKNDTTLSLPLSPDKVFYYGAIHQQFFRVKFRQIHFENKEPFAWSFLI